MLNRRVMLLSQVPHLAYGNRLTPSKQLQLGAQSKKRRKPHTGGALKDPSDDCGPETSIQRGRGVTVVTRVIGVLQGRATSEDGDRLQMAPSRISGPERRLMTIL